jgi:hypothetical protein
MGFCIVLAAPFKQGLGETWAIVLSAPVRIHADVNYDKVVQITTYGWNGP